MIEGSYFKFFYFPLLFFFAHGDTFVSTFTLKRKKRELSCDTEVCVRMSGTVYLILSTIWA